MPLRPAIAEVINGRDLTAEQAREAMAVIMAGEATPAQIGSYLTALRMKGETVAEIAGSAQAMREQAVQVTVDLADGEVLVDTCGTGGDGKQTFNISTTAAFVVAAAGVRVAKHGNRAASSLCGSADVLLALGGNLDLEPAAVGDCIAEVGLGFLYAVNHHPAMRHAIGPRREMGQRTIFNVLGPLTNPARATHQLLGVYDPALTETLAQVLASLGSQAACVVHGPDGLDELSTAGLNRISRLAGGRVTTSSLDPRELDLAPATLADLAGGLPADNARLTRDILSGADRGPRRDVVLLNAAAALTLDGDAWPPAVARAREAIDSGAALACLEAWIATTHRLGAKS